MVSQGIGRGELFKPLILWEKGQMSKGKPIQLSTTLFVFYAQSSKIGEGSYFLGMGNAWGSNLNMGSYPFFVKHFFGFLGK